MIEIQELRKLLDLARTELAGRAMHDEGTCDAECEFHRLLRDIKDALAEPVVDCAECAAWHEVIVSPTQGPPKCEHGVEYGGMGVSLCPRCDQKALILASNETPTAKA